MGQTFYRALLILAISLALGVVANVGSPRRIPWITPPKVEPKADEYIPLDQAQQLWSTGASVFLDAREPVEFANGHIANALNLPIQSFDQHFGEVMPRITPQSSLVVYCDGLECELSHRLAARLREMTFTNVHILHNGWTVWREANLPTQQGSGK